MRGVNARHLIWLYELPALSVAIEMPCPAALHVKAMGPLDYIHPLFARVPPYIQKALAAPLCAPSPYLFEVYRKKTRFNAPKPEPACIASADSPWNVRGLVVTQERT